MSDLPACPSAATVNALAARWTEKNPMLGTRLGRAVALVANVMPGNKSPNVFFVEGTTDRYMVRVDRVNRTSTCTCPDAEKGNHCKHRLAVALYEVGLATEITAALNGGV